MRLLFFITALFFMHTIVGQQYRRDPHEILYDSSKVAVRTFSAEKIKSYNEDQDFSIQTVIKNHQNLYGTGFGNGSGIR